MGKASGQGLQEAVQEAGGGVPEARVGRGGSEVRGKAGKRSLGQNVIMT